MHQRLKSVFATGASFALMASAAAARDFNIPDGDLGAALNAYMAQSGAALVISLDAVKGVRTHGVKGDLPPDAALSRILSGTGFTAQHDSGVIAIVRQQRQSSIGGVQSLQLAQATTPRPSVETVTVTSSKLGGGDVQSIPISITALSQEQLTATQTAGGPDLVKQVPNLTFTKTNFTGYSIQIRGIGTQAVSVTTDPAVAVALNDIPFIRNHFFEQEFYDVGQVEVVRGPQGTLYGRNATAGVVNLISAKPTDQFEAMASADIGNYHNRRFEGMVNLPIVDDRLDLRVAGEWTKRDGYSFNDQTGQPVDGRDLWSSRVTLGWKPLGNVQSYLVWEHFQETDDRLRSGKQLCHRDPGSGIVDGPAGPQDPTGLISSAFLTQGCLPGSLYAPSAFGTPNAAAVPFIAGLFVETGYLPIGADPYAGVVQSDNLRHIDSLLSPHYSAKNDTIELNVNYDFSPALTIVSQTGFSSDSLYSTEDYDRFNSAAGLFIDAPGQGGLIGQDGQYCDPQLGCSSRLVGEDVSQEHAQQYSEELRLSSNYKGPLNFSIGGNFLHYSTIEDYYVFYNAISLLAQSLNIITSGYHYGPDVPHAAFDPAFANSCGPIVSGYPPSLTAGFFGLGCGYIDPNSLAQIDGDGHNYFRSNNPYRLTSYAGFGEVYYQVTPDLKLTGGLRWTDDQKHFTVIPSWAIVRGKGYPVAGTVDQQWKEWTGRFNASWTPKLDFTDQSLFYASYARGYKGGGANPPGVVPVVTNTGVNVDSPSNATHPVTFKPEFVDAFELGPRTPCWMVR